MLDTRCYKYSPQYAAEIGGLNSFKEEWDECAKLLHNNMNSAVSHTTALKAFKGALEGRYDGEVAFDAALLKVWGTLMGNDLQRVETGGQNLKAFRLTHNPEVGIIRQVKHSALFNNATPVSSYGLTSESISDHAVVIFEGGDSSSARDCMAVTEFKTAKTNCSQFATNMVGQIEKPNLQGGHAPIGQVMVYAAGDVLSSLRRNGLDDKRLPLLVLACNLTKRVTSPSPYSCVRGELKLPTTIGDSFEYSIKDAVEFSTSGWAEKAATAYVMVMKEGLERAIKITSATGALPKPASLCGSKFSYRGGLLNCELVGTPLPQPRSKDVYEALPFRMGQGEMFTCDLQASSGSDPGSIDDAPSTGGAVLLKVTCVSAHAYLHFPSTSDLALVAVKNKDQSILRDVLIDHHIYRNQETLVMLLKDLKADGYQDFHPQELAADIGKSGLWEAITDLTERVLIPMAEAEVVHADFRFGWDQTFNLMALLQTDDAVGGRLVLQPIDLESLVPIYMDFPLVAGTFNLACDQIQPDESPDRKALRYVWWQIVLVAVAWFHEKSQRDLNAQHVIQLVSNDVQDESLRVDSRLDWFDAEFWKQLRALLKGLVNTKSFGTQQAIEQLLQWVRLMFVDSTV